MERKFKDDKYESTIAQTIGGSEADPNDQSPAQKCLNGISQGDGEQNRDGRAYTILSIHIRGYVLFGAQIAATTADHVRLLLILDTQTNGAQFNAEDVLDNASGDNDLQTVAFRNLEYTQRFRVLQDFTIRKPVQAQSAGGNNTINSTAATKPFVCNYKFKKGLKVLSTGTAGTVANIVDNSLHMIAISVNNTNTLRYISRVRFVG